MNSRHANLFRPSFSSVARRTSARRCTAAMGMLISLLMLNGCSNHSRMPLHYGARRGVGAKAIDGTSVLATMFELRGYKVYSWDRLSPKLNRYQVIVWFPDDFAPPTDKPRRHLEQWLTRGKGRTVIYVGRDYDAATHFWQAMETLASPREKLDAWRQASLARARHAARRLSIPEKTVCEWFSLQRAAPYRRVTTLGGPLAKNVKPDQTNLWLQSVPRVPTIKELNKLWGPSSPPPPEEPEYEVLLYSGSTPLVTRITKTDWYYGQILVVANGSFLLNYPLVNKQHRKLAGKLIDFCGASEVGSKVAFLVSGPGGPPVSMHESDQRPDSMQRERVVMALHWLVLGLVVCFSLFPIFGRPRTPPSESTADFGQHIDALANLLQRTNDERFARAQITSYRLTAYRDSGASHKQSPRPTRDSTATTSQEETAKRPQEPGTRKPNAAGRSSANPDTEN